MRPQQNTSSTFPILRPKNNPFTGFNNGYFNPSIELSTPKKGETNENKLVVDITIDIQQKELESLWKEGDVECGFILSCSDTNFSKVYRCKKKKDQIIIDKDLIFKKFKIVPVMWSASNLHNYYSNDFKGIYFGKKFTIEKGEFLAIGSEFTDSLGYAEGSDEIFQFEGTGSADKMEFNYSGDYFIIKLPKDVKKSFDLYDKDSHKKIILSKLFMFEPLCFALSLLNEEQFEDKHWFKSFYRFVDSKTGDAEFVKDNIKGDNIENLHQYVNLLLEDDVNRKSALLTTVKALDELEVSK